MSKHEIVNLSVVLVQCTYTIRNKSCNCCVQCVFCSIFCYKALKRIQSHKFHFLMVKNIWFDTKIIKIGPENPVLWQNMCFQCQKWRPSWKITAILKIQVANGFSLISWPRRTFMQILVLVSGFERFLQLSASLIREAYIIIVFVFFRVSFFYTFLFVFTFFIFFSL